MRKERPGGVVVVALLDLVLAALYGLALSQWDFLSDSALINRLVPITTVAPTTVTTAVIAILFLIHFVAGIGLFLMKTWAWRLAILITGVGLAIYLAIDFSGNPASIRLAIYAAIAFYLNSSAVRDAFLSRSDALATHDSAYEPGHSDGASS